MPETVAVESDRQRAVAKLQSTIKGIRIAMLTTSTVDGALRSRPMATQEQDFDGDLWFFTERQSPKVQEMSEDQHVNLSYADAGSNRYVSVSGRARLIHDPAKAKELWSPLYKAWFPGGVDDPQLGLLKVQVDSAEYWDGPSSKMVQLVGFVKAAVTGQKFEPGKNEKLELSSSA